MKRMEIFCASEASTAVSIATDPACWGGGGRGIDRHNPIITDGKRSSSSFPIHPPCSSQLSPINPQPYHHLHKTHKPDPNTDPTHPNNNSASSHNRLHKKKSSSFIRTDLLRWSCAKPTDLATPPCSTRYLLNDMSFQDTASDRLSTAIIEVESDKKVKDECKAEIESAAETPSLSDQVVVLRVSLHCRGCEGKVRKHLSKMEGVSSFNIDFAAKKVTINTVGNVTPESVLDCVSKVKNAQFWTSSSSLQNPNHQQKNAFENLKA